MRLPLAVEAGDSIRDGTGESVGIGKGTVGELMLLQVAPASLDVVQLGGVFWQPFEGEPGGRNQGNSIHRLDGRAAFDFSEVKSTWRKRWIGCGISLNGCRITEP